MSYESKPLRVAVWSTGGIGSHLDRRHSAATRPRARGRLVHSPEKVGVDAGQLANGAPIGLLATSDTDALDRAQPDCVVYAASGPDRDRGIGPGLRSSPGGGHQCGYHELDPPHLSTGIRPRGRRPAETGDASGTGVDLRLGHRARICPGPARLVLTTQSSTIKSIKSTEIGLYDDYAVADVMMDGMGFGRPMDFEPFICMPGVVTHEWSGGLYMIADALGVEIQEVRESVERIPTSRTLQVACGTIEAGTSGAIRTRAIGVVEGNEALEIAHVTRMALDVAPEWPSTEHGVGYQIDIEGEPNIHCEMSCTLDDPARIGIKGMQARRGGHGGHSDAGRQRDSLRRGGPGGPAVIAGSQPHAAPQPLRTLSDPLNCAATSSGDVERLSR